MLFTRDEINIHDRNNGKNFMRDWIKKDLRLQKEK